MQMLHGSPLAVAVAEGLVDQVQVHVIETEPFEGLRGRDGLLGLVRGNVEDTETEDGHLDAVVERNGGESSSKVAESEWSACFGTTWPRISVNAPGQSQMKSPC